MLASRCVVMILIYILGMSHDFLFSLLFLIVFPPSQERKYIVDSEKFCTELGRHVIAGGMN